jgi:hypothetical protein
MQWVGYWAVPKESQMAGRSVELSVGWLADRWEQLKVGKTADQSEPKSAAPKVG